MDALAYLDQLLKLLPRGKAWRAQDGSMLRQLMLAFADGAARFDQRLVDLIREADPRTTTELVGTWETMVGLPDNCTLLLTDIADRRKAIWAKLTSTGGQSEPYFREIASRLGYDITITRFHPAHMGDRLGVRIYTTPWRFTWQVNVRPSWNVFSPSSSRPTRPSFSPISEG